MFRFPWGDMHSLNLGWFLQKFNELREDWATAEENIDGALDAEIEKAEDALSDVFAARDAAAASATAAAGSATAAGTSATAAQNSATAAASSATLANQKATAAGLSEAAAAQSAAAAGQSAAAAAGSATQASQSATNAAASETAAGNSAAAAAASAASIEGAVDAAEESANNAATSEQQAAAYAQQAGQAVTPYEPVMIAPDLLTVIKTDAATVANRKISVLKNKIVLEASGDSGTYVNTVLTKSFNQSQGSTLPLSYENAIPVLIPASSRAVLKAVQIRDANINQNDVLFVYGFDANGEQIYSPTGFNIPSCQIITIPETVKYIEIIYRSRAATANRTTIISLEPYPVS